MSTPRPRLTFDHWPAAVYAIGDVHGCLEQLLKLEAMIVADGDGMAGEKWIVTLGDYIDRGRSSPAVIDHIMSPAPTGFRRIALVGNHEKLMLDFLDNAAATLEWLEWGGVATAEAYGVPPDPEQHWRRDPYGYADRLRPLIPAAHLDLLRKLPVCLSLPRYFFVHAGIRPGVPLGRQEEQDLIWIRAPFLNGKLAGDVTVVHGHTPVDGVEMAPGRIDIDTGCFYSGVLTALRVTPEGPVQVLQAHGAKANYTPANQRG
jgi:serine/threonine protein phosphatase 1